MNIILSTLNAKYIHTSLALNSIKSYCTNYKNDIKIVEFTINHQENYILNEIYKLQPDILGFSCYIWNIENILELIKIIKKILPHTIIILGGPEVSYDGETLMEKYKDIDIIVFGEGEQTFYDIIEHFKKGNKSLEEIDGIIYRIGEKIIKNKPRMPLNLDDIPFVYENFSDIRNRIIYYETSRGCPYNCQYCLSSIEDRVRFLSLDRVYSDLQRFLDERVKQVKFVDRTFNASKNHALAIWKYLIENDNGITNFHFEIAGEILEDDIIEFLSKARPGLFQFEIGVQTTNKETLKNISRKMDFKKLKKVVQSIQKGKNIHQHLDLIAGLPGEDYKSFRNSFNDVHNLYPEQLQLGFLKVLKGSGLWKKAKQYGLVYKDKAPYEILFTRELNYKEMLKLKMIEEMVETYYNSTHFYYSIRYMLHFFDTPFDFYEALGEYWEKEGYHHVKHNKIKLYTILYEFFKNTVQEKEEILKEILKFDMCLMEKVKKVPEWMPINEEKYKLRIRNFYKNKENIEKYLPNLIGFSSKTISHIAHLEVFLVDFTYWIKSIKAGKEILKIEKKPTPILFDYNSKDNILGHATFYKVTI
ncbi:B12-binding domain-containing radical SAM protein [Defluviitalea phaphyphila]|uniref:B12-binding domain-containing radical SAM protein n=1 Tax=Defluviitalea phaphyphila TaxID=1473580 RepID=UPI00072FE1C5|nr:B12-binding domain-containing radical SAM protein [Defluviitalea phaphyphila]